MKNKYIVRADFYPEGDIVPLGITIVGGDTIYVTRVIEKKQKCINEFEFKCLTRYGECTLTLTNNKWSVFME